MSRRCSRVRSWSAFAALAWCALAPSVLAAAQIDHPTEFLDRAEDMRRKDHAEFARMLAQLHGESPPLTLGEQWRLRYLDAWEAQFNGDYSKAETQIHQILDHSEDPTLISKASALLLNNLAVNRRYEEGFALANRLVVSLPGIKDPATRFTLLSNLSTMLDLAGQQDLAITYANMMTDVIPPGESACYPMYLRSTAMTDAKRLTSSSPEIQQTIDVCTASHDTVIANAMWLVLGDLYIDEGDAKKALAMLDGIDGAIRDLGYHPQMISASSQRARAYEKLGRYDDAKSAALAATALAEPGEINEWLRVAYGVLYRIEKKQNNPVAALADYEHYVDQEKGDLNDVTARTVAYELSQQQMLTKKLEAEGLGKQNNILKLQQALDTKAVETGRLYIALLLIIIASITLWVVRLKRSQLRFKRLALHDGLTGIYHHQHFMSEVQRALQASEKRGGGACLVCIDLDHFKQVNDDHGHAVGDAALRHIVAICRLQLRPGDLFGRLGGEEFGILLMDVNTERGITIAERVRRAFEASPLMEEGHVVALSASMGVACTGTSGYSLQGLCRDSDTALYRAKRAGRNRVVAYDAVAPEAVTS